ncbi:PKD domain-containing protein [Conexibacter sp. W3-3-2]|uniref:PKD domain-containing protein n=1 Tax=Conexibacter sp. W3-3-2 TaxID=2675227 RepID=UPI001E32DC02|nr:PKD domain-containing protein [Conexibacter sp. W3-3-2]
MSSSNLRRRRAITGAVIAVLVAVGGTAPVASAAEPEGPQLNATDSTGDAAGGLGDLVAHRWDARGWPTNGARLSLRQSNAGGWAQTSTYLDADRDGVPDLLIATAGGLGTGPVSVQAGPPGVSEGSVNCYFRGFPTSGPTFTTTVPQSVSGNDRRLEVVLPSSALAAYGAGLALAPRMVTVALELSEGAPQRDHLPDAARSGAPCTSRGVDVAMVRGTDRGQTSAGPRRQRLLDGTAPDAQSDGDLLSAEIRQFTGTQPNADPTALGTTPGAVTVNPADLLVRFRSATTATGAAATVYLFSGWLDTESTRGVPIGAVRLRNGTTDHVLVDVFRKRSGSPLASGTNVCLPDLATDMVLLRESVPISATDGVATIPLDLALGIFDGVQTNRDTWRSALVGRGAGPDHLPDPLGFDGSGNALGVCAGDGIRINPDHTVGTRANGAALVASIAASPAQVARGGTLTLDGSDTVAGPFPRSLRFEADGGRVFSATGQDTRQFPNRQSAQTARVLARDTSGYVDMAAAPYTVTNVPPTAVIGPSTSRIALPFDAPSIAQVTFDANGSGDPDTGNPVTWGWTLREGDAAGPIVRQQAGGDVHHPGALARPGGPHLPPAARRHRQRRRDDGRHPHPHARRRPRGDDRLRHARDALPGRHGDADREVHDPGDRPAVHVRLGPGSRGRLRRVHRVGHHDRRVPDRRLARGEAPRPGRRRQRRRVRPEDGRRHPGRPDAAAGGARRDRRRSGRAPRAAAQRGGRRALRRVRLLAEGPGRDPVPLPVRLR